MINLILGDCLQKLRELPARIDTEFGSAWLDKDKNDIKLDQLDFKDL